MDTCFRLRNVIVDDLHVKIWVRSDDPQCEHCDQVADEAAMLARALVTADDSPADAASTIYTHLRTVAIVEAFDGRGEGIFLNCDAERLVEPQDEVAEL